jgi:hypothetical protein
MDASDVVTIVKDQVDAYNTRDIDAVMRYYADDAVILDGFGAVIAEGRDGIRAVYERVFTNNPCRRPNGFQRWQLGRDSFDSAELGDAGRPQVANAVDRRLSGE